MRYSKKPRTLHNYAVLKDVVVTCDFPNVSLGFYVLYLMTKYKFT